MSLATSIASALVSGPSSPTGVSLDGSLQIIIDGTFTSTAGKKALVVMEVSADDGTTFVPVPGSRADAPTSYIMDLGTGSRVRANVFGGGAGVAINVRAGALP